MGHASTGWRQTPSRTAPPSALTRAELVQMLERPGSVDALTRAGVDIYNAKSKLPELTHRPVAGARRTESETSVASRNIAKNQGACCSRGIGRPTPRPTLRHPLRHPLNPFGVRAPPPVQCICHIYVCIYVIHMHRMSYACIISCVCDTYHDDACIYHMYISYVARI